MLPDEADLVNLFGWIQRLCIVGRARPAHKYNPARVNKIIRERQRRP
jgi:hypothetical protein